MKKNLRKISQIFFFGLIFLISINHFLVESGSGIPFISSESLHAICPFGGVVTLYQLITVGSFIEKIHLSAVIILFLLMVLSFLFGPVFCGWVCPFGTYQEWINNIGKKVFKKKYNKIIPGAIKKYLKYLRFLVLIWVVYVTATTTVLMFQKIDPYFALFNFYTGEVEATALVILGLFTGLSLVESRPFCKYFCPLGALLGISNKFRIFSIRRNDTTCIQCSKCDNACPMAIEISNKSKVKDLQCISCLECTSENICPIEETVQLKVGDFHV